MRLDTRSASAVAGLLCVLLPSGLGAQSNPSPPPPAVLLRHTTLLDGSNSTPQMDVAITVRDGRIESVRPDHVEATRRGSTPDSVIDLHGAWVVPGLIDAHAHLMRERGSCLVPVTKTGPERTARLGYAEESICEL